MYYVKTDKKKLKYWAKKVVFRTLGTYICYVYVALDKIAEVRVHLAKKISQATCNLDKLGASKVLDSDIFLFNKKDPRRSYKVSF